MAIRLSLPIVLLAALATAPAVSAECRQENAIYEDRDKAYELAFAPVDSAAAATSHRFMVKVLKTGLALDGIVMMSGDEVPRPNGMIMHDCPEGDATGEEIAACTVWEGVIYRQDDAGVIDILPGAESAAAPQLLFPGLGPAVRYSAIWQEGKASVAPWDVLTLKGCGNE
ncbi:MAG: hypothetical protein QHC90_17545 [Shinella sp.]|nr:hypothetical protein [Shinella sp.]